MLRCLTRLGPLCLFSRLAAMSFDKNMLTPRGLLVNRKFVCQGTSFSNLIININKMMSIPHTKQQIVDVFHIPDFGAVELIDILDDMIRFMDKRQESSRQANVSSINMSNTIPIFNTQVGYHDVGTLCDKISVLAAAAPKDYDEIFDGLARLYKDEAHNVELRNAIKAKIDARLADIRAASSSGTANRNALADFTDAIDLAQGQLQYFSQHLNWAEVYSRIVQKFLSSWIGEGQNVWSEIALNITAFSLIRAWISQLELTGGTASSLRELQEAVGGIAEIDGDLISLRKYIEENTEPGPNPILNLQKGNIVEMWEELDREVKKFKSNFIDTA
ncbi:hypothetical protein C2857_005084 [Epichloe festucae Fl1]|uniref:Uncharacterized protein n=1 Tax=Epichloe festucae (strain Fl1) TaxID=877507 RepID=A0A7U3Q2R3_EPIFF|nr:hypothetical protein C2857_005084 [Epichloe festucae Fl1]